MIQFYTSLSYQFKSIQTQNHESLSRTEQITSVQKSEKLLFWLVHKWNWSSAEWKEMRVLAILPWLISMACLNNCVKDSEQEHEWLNRNQAVIPKKLQDPSVTILWNSYRSFKTVFKRNLAVFCQKKHSIITASLNGSKQRLLRFCGSSFAVPLLLLDVTSMYLLRKLAEEDLKWKYAFLAAQELFGWYHGVEVGMQLMLLIVKRPSRFGPTTTKNHCSLER